MTLKKVLLIFGGILAVLGALFVRPRPNPTGESGAPAAAASGPQILWKAEGGFTTIALGPDGTIYGGAYNSIRAISPGGNVKWKKQLAGNLYPVIGDDGNIYLASSMGFVWGLSPDGNTVWDPKYGLIGFGGPPALGPNGLLFYANTMSDLWAFHPPDARHVWSRDTVREGFLSPTSSLPAASHTGGAHSRSSPVLWRDGSILLPRQRWLHRFNPDGSQDWTTELTPGTLGLAALAEDGTIYVADDRKSLFAVDRSGNVKWSVEGAVPNETPIVGPDGTIYLTTTAKVFALKPDGSTKWEIDGPKFSRSSPVLAEDGTLYLTSDQGLTALRSDGTEKWTFKTPVAGAPTIGPDGTLYVACGYNQLCAIRDEGSPLAKSGWPKVFHDNANSGRTVKML